MASIRKEISTTAHAGDVWDALADIGALHTRLVPGFVTDTKLEPGARIVTFGNGMVVRELIVTVDHGERRIVWSAVGGSLQHHNASAQVLTDDAGGTKVVWIADLLPDEAAPSIATMMEQGMAVVKKTLEQIPLGRWAEVEDIVNAALLLCSDLANYITGHTLHVNGGYYMD